MRIAVGSDHAGLRAQGTRRGDAARRPGHDVVDVGTDSAGVGRLPALRRARPRRLVADGEAERAVLACGSGVGVAIVANKVAGVRAVNAHDAAEAEMARRHNDANVVTLCGARLAARRRPTAIVAAFLRTAFEGGRHARRVGQIADVERGRDSVVPSGSAAATGA